jgi:alpha-galactosidase
MNTKAIKITAIAVLLLLCAGALAEDEDAPKPSPFAGTLALTPPMGWNSWNKFACNVSEELLRQTTDAMVKSGMKDAGYQYVVIDDCWLVSRDKDGNPVPDAQRFPSGMKALGDYIHSLGLKFGIYSDAGIHTCEGRPGARGYEFQDARQYAAWGVDYLKLDWCSTSTQDGPSSYALMRQALDATGRPIVFSMCEWGTNKPWLWGEKVGGNLWRTTDDIADKFVNGNKKGGGMLNVLDLQVGLEGYAGPGHWNDPDMLEVGNGGMTNTEYRSHFSLWSILAAPLLAGNDLRSMTPEIRDILANKEVIAVDQDALGSQGKRVVKNGDLEVWVKQLKDGSRAVVLFNRGGAQQEIGVSWEELGYPEHFSAAVRDLWQHKDLGKFTGRFSAPVESHGVVMVTVRP